MPQKQLLELLTPEFRKSSKKTLKIAHNVLFFRQLCRGAILIRGLSGGLDSE
jgi:hypothetical protein